MSASNIRIQSLGSTRNTKFSSSRSILSITSLLTHGIFGLFCFYMGLLVGMSGSKSGDNHSTSNGATASLAEARPCPSCPSCPKVTPSNAAALRASVHNEESSANLNNNNNNNNSKTFPPSTLSNMFSDFATVSRVELNNVLEVGVPLDDTKPGAEDALILYSSKRSLPTKTNTSNNTLLSATDALENCRTVKLVLMETAQQHAVPECLAILPQWESYYVHKFMRLPIDNHGGIDPESPLRYVSRSHNTKGQYTNVPNYERHTKPFYDTLIEYLQHLDHILDELRPKLQRLVEESSNPNSKSIIVQVCNYGQVELFHNYICNAKAKGLDTSHIFLFATDEKTYELCQILGIHAYYNQAIFGDMPENAAHGYGDRIFTKMMMAKVYCVHLVLSLEYNVLFQDVDMVWYQNPLPYLESNELQEWDVMFQDDGARSDRYAPYSPNTGFYYVRYSAETLFFFGMLLRSGDVVAKTTSHQAALNALLNEHASYKGLRVKVWKKGEMNPFPGGVEYHRSKDLMKRLLTKNWQELERRRKNHPNGGQTIDEDPIPNDLTVEPYIFHMSWTKNKDNKKLYFQQMGEWYLKEDCLSGWDCCLSEPKITCHYRDKPSIVSCKDSPPIDAGRPSFW